MINNTTISTNLDAQSVGRASSGAFVDQFATRDPTANDINYPIQKKWLNTTAGTFWELEKFTSSIGVVSASWIKIGSVGLTETLTGNDSIAVPATSNNINVVGDGTYITTTGNAATSTLTISPAGGLTTLYTEDTGTATPSSGNLNVKGGTGINTSGSGNTITINGNISKSAASSSLTNVGVASFNNEDFTVDGNGFVTLTGGSAVESFTVDAHTAPGTNPVVPSNTGAVTVTGGQIAAGTTTNVIRTDSLSANTYTIEIQRSQAAASTTVGDNGVCHFDSAQFNLDSNAFVSLVNPCPVISSGTFTPILAFGGLSTGITYGSRMGTYYVIGPIVFFSMYFILTSKGSATGNATISGLPLSNGTVSTNMFLNITPSNVPAGAFLTGSQLPNSTSVMSPYYTAAAGSTIMNDTIFTNTTEVLIQGIYFTT